MNASLTIVYKLYRCQAMAKRQSCQGFARTIVGGAERRTRRRAAASRIYEFTAD
jgi:hypothetical protein